MEKRHAETADNQGEQRLLAASLAAYREGFGRPTRQADGTVLRLSLVVADALGIAPGRLAARLEAGDRKARLAILEALANKETYLFREPAPLLAVRDTLYPTWPARGRPMTVLSAACSRGHELVSLWIMMESKRQALGLPEGSFSLGGLDISADALRDARRALDGADFPCSRMRDGLVPPPVRAAAGRMLEPRGKGMWRLRPGFEARDVRLVQWDLMRPPPADLRADAVLFRNALIHYADAERSRMVGNAAGLLAPGGLLFTGASEVVLDAEAYGLRPLSVGGARAYASV